MSRKWQALCRVLIEREGVAVRILEPGHSGAVGRRPHRSLVLREVGHFQELHTAFHKLVDLSIEVVDLPAEDREWLHVRLCPTLVIRIVAAPAVTTTAKPSSET